MSDLPKIYLNGVDVSGLTEINLDRDAQIALYSGAEGYKPGGFISDDGVLSGRGSYDRGMDGPPVPWPEFFKRFRYKPNFTFECEYDIDANKYSLYMQMLVLDSREQSERMVPVRKYLLLNWHGDYPTLREQCMEIYYELLGAETHECGEWFRFDEQLPFDPHKNEGMS